MIKVTKIKCLEGYRLRATFSDGNERDVTRWAKFTSADETVASVDSNGNVSIIGPGEGANGQ